MKRTVLGVAGVLATMFAFSAAKPATAQASPMAWGVICDLSPHDPETNIWEIWVRRAQDLPWAFEECRVREGRPRLVVRHG
jgi:hypothetical protein